MKKLLAFPVAILLLLGLSGCLIGSDLTQDPVSGPYYFWAFKSADQTQFIKDSTGNQMANATPTVIVNAPVTKAGWDNNWVLIERDHSSYYIFDLNKHKLHGPFNKASFGKSRAALGVPVTLDLNQDYTGKWFG